MMEVPLYEDIIAVYYNIHNYSLKEALVKARNVPLIYTPDGYKSMKDVVEEGKH